MPENDPDGYSESRIQFTNELQPRPDEAVLDEQEAAETLARRLGFSFRRSTSFGEDVRAGLGFPLFLATDRDRLKGDVVDQDKMRLANDLMIRIVRMLPESHRTTSVLTHVDIRPILGELALTEEQAVRSASVHYVNDVPVPAAERVVAKLLLDQENEAVANQVEVVAANMEAAGVFAQSDDPLLARQQWMVSAC